MRHWIGLCAVFALLAATLTPAAADVRGLKLDGGFQEVVISVPEIETAIAFYQKAAGWRVIYRGATDPDMMRAWALPDSAKAVEAVLQDPGNPNGFVRLIRFRGIPQEEARASAHPWDTGGLTAMELRARDVRAKYAQFLFNGWHATSEPVQVNHPNRAVLAAMMQGFGDEVVTLSQPLSPPAEVPRDITAPYAVVTTAKDFDATVAFYTDKLGFKIVREEQSPAGPPGPNILGLPYNLVSNVYQRAADLHPLGPDAPGSKAGAIEVTTLYGAEGTDFAAKARPPNLGLIVVRFAVSDAVGRADALKAKGVALEYPVTAVGMAPYGPVKVFAVRDPNGVQLEFFEPQDKP